MRKLLSFAFLLLFVQTGISQTMISFKDAMPYDENRYADIKASPYLFDTFVKGWITDVEGQQYQPVSMNYNGYSRAFEVRQEDRFISLSPEYYARIDLLPEGQSDTSTFVKNVHPDFRGAFVQRVYESGQIVLIKHFQVGLNENVKNVPNGTVVVKRFSPRDNWYLLTKSDQQLLKLEGNKRRLLKTLGHEKVLNSFLKENKSIDLDTNQGMQALITEWEKLAF
ncbi:MAG TPA: hypothetical protein VJ953_22730 [Saprospiraceae bacterium]|nr:hypothetical protein [Saprospiraceae bacterium]